MSFSYLVQDSISNIISRLDLACPFTSITVHYSAADNPAFLSFLAPDYHNNTDAVDYYFISLRMLGYQLMHAPRTKSRYPFIVAVTKGVDPLKRAQLELDGAIIVELPETHVLGHSGREQFRDQMEKLSFFGMYGTYGRFCYIDADNMVLENLDGIFEDPATQVQVTRSYTDEIRADEPSLPSTYVFAGHSEVTGHNDARRRLRRTQNAHSADYANAGFLVIAPGPEIHEYYMWVANHTDRWNSIWAEQNLYNYCHRRPGNMPSTRLQDYWNIYRPSVVDMSRGAKSVHAHLWEEGYTGPRQDIWKQNFDEMTWFYGNRSGHGV